MPIPLSVTGHLSVVVFLAIVATLGGGAAPLRDQEGRSPAQDRRSRVPADPPKFLFDSSLAVTLAPREGAPPIVITGSYIGQSHELSIAEIREAMVGAIEERKGAQYRVIRGGALLPAPAPSVTIQFDFWSGGGVRSDVILRCESYDAARRPNGDEQHQIATNKRTLSRASLLREHVQELLNQAAELRCPFESSTPPRPTPGPGITGDRATALARARTVSPEIERLVVSVDTVRLRVGEKMHGAAAPRLIAMRADGSVAREWAPLYSVDDRTIIWHRNGGLEALAPGTTRITVRVFSGTAPAAERSTASASFIVVVTP